MKKRRQKPAFSGCGRANARSYLYLHQIIFAAAHFELVHIFQLVQTGAGFDALYQIVLVFFRQGINHVDGSLIDGQNIR